MLVSSSNTIDPIMRALYTIIPHVEPLPMPRSCKFDNPKHRPLGLSHPTGIGLNIIDGVRIIRVHLDFVEAQ